MLARFNADGTPDNSFDGDGILTTKVGISSEGAVAAALQADGKIVVAGYANLTGYDEFAVLRYKSNGTLDNTFGGSFIPARSQHRAFSYAGASIWRRGTGNGAKTQHSLVFSHKSICVEYNLR